jgi:hypothetical protein
MRLLVALAATLAFLAVACTSAHAQYLKGHIVGIEVSPTNPADVYVSYYDPLTGDALQSEPIPPWWTDPYIRLDGTSAKSVTFAFTGSDGFIAFLIATNATVSQQALFVYQYKDNGAVYAPKLSNSCLSNIALLTDLQFIVQNDEPFLGAVTDMMVAPAGTNLAFFEVPFPSGAAPDFCEIAVLASGTTPVPYSLSAMIPNTAYWSYIGYTQTTDAHGQPSYSYAIDFVEFVDTPAPIPLTGLAIPSSFPPQAPWFSLQLVPNIGSMYSGIIAWLINAVDSTVWEVRLEGITQVLTETQQPFVVPTIPVAITFNDTNFNAPVFMWLNDYK